MHNLSFSPSILSLSRYLLIIPRYRRLLVDAMNVKSFIFFRLQLMLSEWS